ncbi:MAG: hypothetical protein AB1921_01445 [Thermodesulfobacteriota bacterium]
MAIQFICPTCSASISTAESNAGRQGKCPKCGNAVQIPGNDPAKPPARPRASREEASGSILQGKGLFSVEGYNVRIMGEPNVNDPSFVREFKAAVTRIGEAGAQVMQLDFSQSAYKSADRAPIVAMAKAALRSYRTQLQICLTGFWKSHEPVSKEED